MNRPLLATVLAFGLLGTGTGTAFASSSDKDGCTAPMAEWQPKQALQQKLEGDGWKVRQIKVDDGCYEVYAVDGKGNRMETYFNPKTFDVVKQGDKD